MAQEKNIIGLTDLLLKCMAEPDPMLSMLKWLCSLLIEAEVTILVGAEKNIHNLKRSDYRCGPIPAAGYSMGTMCLMNFKLRNRGYIPL